MGTSRWGDLWTKSNRSQCRGSAVRQWIRAGIGLASLLSCLLCLTLVLPRHLPARRRAGSPPLAPSPPQTPFQAAFAQAQRSYVDAQKIAKRQLESLEEWDPDNIRGSMPEIYHRTFIARTQEIGRAAEAARDAAHQAQTTEERYRAARLLLHIEHDLGHHRKELEQAEKLVALQPLKPEARLLLERATAENGPAHPKGTAASASDARELQRAVAPLDPGSGAH
jgi:hypothetical protein